MKFIKDLGTKKRKIGTQRYGLWECEGCNKQFERHTQTMISRPEAMCSSCSAIKRNKKHGDSHTKLHQVWIGIRQRCRNLNYKHYKNYGGRGISVCNEWDNYEFFKTWAIENKYKEGLTIDRINNDGNYEPDNCRWTTYKVQANNRRQRKNCSSKYLGLSKTKYNTWQAIYKCKYIGTYKTENEAFLARESFIGDLTDQAYEAEKDRRMLDE